MAKKEIFTILREEELELNFYAVRSKDGKWFRNKGMSGRNSWVDNLSKARIYSSPGPAKTQITFWATHYPEYGIPELVKISTGKCQFLDQTERVEKVKAEKRKASLILQEEAKIRKATNRLRELKSIKSNDISILEAQLNSYKENLQKIKNEIL